MAIALFALAVVGFSLRPNSFETQSLAFLAIVVGAWLIQRSNTYVRRARGQAGAEWEPAKAAKRVEPLAWVLTAASLAACVVFYLAMCVDAAHGGTEAWPAYALGGAVMALAVTSGYVAMKIFR
ncbi:MAG: hypothetical protein WAN14_22270 [Candidatus Acidiferrales bacterium]